MEIAEFLGLQPTHNPHRWFLPITAGISTAERFMFGGCGLGAAILAMELTTERRVVWATAQYLSFAKVGEIMDLDVTVAVAGRYTAQARVIGRVGDREILTVNAAFGERESEFSAQFAEMPSVPPPEECAARSSRWTNSESIMSRIEARLAKGRQWEDFDGVALRDGRSALWVRMPGLELSAAGLAVLGDYVPFGISQALGHWVRSNSLDNTLRVVRLAPTEWVLLDVIVEGVDHGFGHGTVCQWTRDGQLLAVASQSAIVRGTVDVDKVMAAMQAENQDMEPISPGSGSGASDETEVS